MRKKNFKGRCEKRKLSKCEGVCKTYDALQYAYADMLEADNDIVEIRCNVQLECFLQALFGQNCKIFLDIVAKRFWTLLHVQIGQSCNAPAGCVINQP